MAFFGRFEACVIVVRSSDSLPEFPLTSLNLMDYCYVSDVGVANIVSMTTLTTLTLSKTKLTDTGMHCVAGECRDFLSIAHTLYIVRPSLPLSLSLPLPLPPPLPTFSLPPPLPPPPQLCQLFVI